MKSIIKKIEVILTGVVLISVLACSNSETKNVSETSTAINTEKVVVADYKVEGMVCAMGCAKTIQDELTGMNGIAACEVNFEEGKAHIEFDESQLSEKEVIAVIEGLADGQYKVSKWTESDVVGAEMENNEEAEETVSDVSLPSFKIPNLFKLLFEQL